MHPNAQLFDAARKGDAPLLQDLLVRGADINARNEDGWTALHLARGNGRLDTVAALVVSGADIEIRSDRGQSPMEVAVLIGGARMVLALIAAGSAEGPTLREKEIVHPFGSLGRILRLDGLCAAAKLGHRLLLSHAIAVSNLDSISISAGLQRLRTATAHALTHDQPDAAAYLQALQAQRTIEASLAAAAAVPPL